MARGYNLGLAVGLSVLGSLVGCAATEDDMMDDAAQASTGEAGEDGQEGSGGEVDDDGTDGAGSADGGGGEGPGDDGAGEGDGGTGGADDGDGGSTTGAGSDCEMGLVAPSEVVLIGDSYFDATRVALDLYVHARLAGSLGPMEEYREYYQGGTQMSNGQIPAQYDAAKNDDPVINTVIMTGGGNDVLIGSANNCLQNPPEEDAGCRSALDNVFNAAEGLISAMAADGVENVIYFFYPHLPDGGFVSGAKNETLDYAYPIVRDLCESAEGTNCIFVDTRDAFEGHQNEYFLDDGIHPNDAGAQVIADLLWETMVENCVAQ